MTRDDLEAAIWRRFRIFKITTDEPVLFVDSIVELAEAYAAGDGPEVTAARRAVLDRERS